MPPLNYSKWDNLDDSDDEEAEAPVGMKTGASRPEPQGQGQEAKQTASVLPAFVVQSVSIADKRPTYINVVSSPAVPGGAMTGVASDEGGVTASFPYICGDLRTDTDLQSAPCYVIELIVHPETMKRAEKDRQTQMAVIKTALAVVSEKSIPVQAESWSMCESESLREPSGAYFFAPGRMMQAAAARAGAATSTAAASMGDEDLADIDDDDEGDSPVE